MLLKLCQDDAVEEGAIVAELEEPDELATTFRIVLIKFDCLLNRKSPSNPCGVLPMCPISPSATGGPSSATGGSPVGSHVRTGPNASVYNKTMLPKLEIKRFNGEICFLQDFLDCFKSSVDSDKDFPPMMKLNFSCGPFNGPVKAIIAGFETTNANYAEAFDVLKHRYKKKMVIKLAHLNGIMNHSAIKDENANVGLWKFHSTMDVHCRGLRASGVDEETYFAIVVQEIVEKLRKDLRLTIVEGGYFELDY